MTLRKILLFSVLFGLTVPLVKADNDYEDDIYYNPKKVKTETKKKETKSNYIANFEDLDVDTYNRRGQYYLSPVDTIGASVENGEDFVYTQQIQKFYNPTIVVDNSDVLADVLANSYGNVDIVYNFGTPSFAYNYNWPYYSWPYYNWGWGPSFSFGWGGWNIGWGGWYDPWYAWGPSWGWGPSWSWGPAWGPSWGWGGGFPTYLPNTPNGNHRVGPGGGWAQNTRPGGNYNGGSHQTGGFYGKPGSSVSQTGGNHRVSGVYSGGTKGDVTGGGYRINSNGHRVTGSGTSSSKVNNGSAAGGNHRTTGTVKMNSNSNNNTSREVNNNHRSYNSNVNRNNTNTYNSNGYNNRSSGSYNSGGSHRSSGGGFSGGNSGGGRGRHR